MTPTNFRRASAALALALIASRLSAQQCALNPTLPTPCELLGVGAPLPYPNAAASPLLAFPAGTTVTVYILGHSENRGYDDELQALLNADPIHPGLSFNVLNRFINGHEAWRWATPGQQGYQRIEAMLQFAQRPFIVLGLFSNNETFPIGAPDPSDANYARFVDDLSLIAEHVHDGGQGASMVYLSAHRYKPSNMLPSWYENCAIGGVMERAALGGDGHLKPGPAQHDLHWCCLPSCYASDQSHTNDLGDALMARTWHAFLARELTGVGPNCEGALNSTGASAALSVQGSTSVAANQFALRVNGGVPGAPAMFFLGEDPHFAPFADGALCIGAPRLRVPPVTSFNALGVIDAPLDLTTLPTTLGAGAIQAGDTLHFQLWYRDGAAAGSGANTSSAVEVLFLP